MKSSSANFDHRAARGAAQVAEAAAQWIVRRDAGLSPGERQAFDQWLAADACHAVIYAELESTWAAVNRPRVEGRGEAFFSSATAGAHRNRRRRRSVAFAAMGLAIAAAWMVVFQPARPRPAPAASSIVLHPNRQALPDGSTVELNAGAEISLEYVPEKRGVKLLRGEALFEVFKNPLRPFVVIADQIEVRAVGTAFTVRQAADAITVLVTEGKVSIDCTGPVTGEAPPRHFSVPIQVAAGCATTIPRSPSAGPPTTKAVSPDEINAALAWRDRCIEFTGTPLAETLEHFNRRTERQLVIGDELTGALRITGIVWTDDPDGFARLLESSLGVKADYSVRGKIILRQP